MCQKHHILCSSQPGCGRPDLVVRTGVGSQAVSHTRSSESKAGQMGSRGQEAGRVRLSAGQRQAVGAGSTSEAVLIRETHLHGKIPVLVLGFNRSWEPIRTPRVLPIRSQDWHPLSGLSFQFWQLLAWNRLLGSRSGLTGF